MMKQLWVLAAALLTATSAFAQTGTGQIGAGQVLGNASASRAPAGPENVTAILDRALSAVQGRVLYRNATNWDDTNAPVLGIPGTAAGSIGFAGSTSGTVSLVPQAAAGTPTLTFPNTSGTFAVGATAPLALSATTGAVSITGAAGQVLAGAGPAFTATPDLGVPGVTSGRIIFRNSTGGPTGYVQLQTVSGALGNTDIFLPSAGGTLAVSAAAPLGLNATTGALSITGAALTKTDDTNVTLTLGGSSASALVAATSITAGWTGQLALARGGTNASLTASNGGLVYSTGAALAILSGTATAGQIPLSGANAAPAWSAATYPATASAGTLLAAGTSNIITATATPTLGANGGTGGQITLNGATSGSVILRVPAAAGTGTIFQLPNNNGSNGYVLSSDGAGVTSWIAAGGTGTVTNVATSGILTGGPITTTGMLGVNASITPQHRVTLTSGTAVMASNVAGATTIYSTPYGGNLIPIYDGTNLVPTACPELSNITTNAATGNAGPAAVAASSIYDLFVWNNGGTCTLTRSPAWTNSTTRGFTFTVVNGIPLNTSAITNGPAASRGTWVATVASNSSGTIDWIYGGSSAGGTGARLMVWNAYNRVSVSTTSTDTTTLTYQTATIRQWRGATDMQIAFVLGGQEDAVTYSFSTEVTPVSSIGALGVVGIGFDTTTAYSRQRVRTQNVAAATWVSTASQTGTWSAPIGTHIISLNQSGDGSTLTEFNNSASAFLAAELRM